MTRNRNTSRGVGKRKGIRSSECLPDLCGAQCTPARGNRQGLPILLLRHARHKTGGKAEQHLRSSWTFAACGECQGLPMLLLSHTHPTTASQRWEVKNKMKNGALCVLTRGNCQGLLILLLLGMHVIQQGRKRSKPEQGVTNRVLNGCSMSAVRCASCAIQQTIGERETECSSTEGKNDRGQCVAAGCPYPACMRGDKFLQHRYATEAGAPPEMNWTLLKA